MAGGVCGGVGSAVLMWSRFTHPSCELLPEPALVDVRDPADLSCTILMLEAHVIAEAGAGVGLDAGEVQEVGGGDEIPDRPGVGATRDGARLVRLAVQVLFQDGEE